MTLVGIPQEVYEYRLGNRSALHWVIDLYQVSTDKRSGIVSDPNRPEDPEYIVRLVGQVVAVSVETVKRTFEGPSNRAGLPTSIVAIAHFPMSRPICELSTALNMGVTAPERPCQPQ